MFISIKYSQRLFFFFFFLKFISILTDSNRERLCWTSETWVFLYLAPHFPLANNVFFFYLTPTHPNTLSNYFVCFNFDLGKMTTNIPQLSISIFHVHVHSLSSNCMSITSSFSNHFNASAYFFSHLHEEKDKKMWIRKDKTMKTNKIM